MHLRQLLFLESFWTTVNSIEGWYGVVRRLLIYNNNNFATSTLTFSSRKKENTADKKSHYLATSLDVEESAERKKKYSMLTIFV